MPVRNWRKRVRQEIEIVSYQDGRYPRPLKEIFDPPILLYARGRVELLSGHNLAVVGSRRPSPYGMSVAQKLGRELVQTGLVVVSGMARGVDSLAHRGALDAGGNTIAVLGCGVDVVYPRENEKLAQRNRGAWAYGLGIPSGLDSVPTELSDPQPHHQWHQLRGYRSRGGAVQRLADYCTTGPGPGA